MKCNQLSSGIRVLCAAAVIFGTIPALAILADEPAAMATTLYAEEPPQPPQLSDEEQEALDRKNSGQSMTEAQKKAAQRAEDKQRQPRSTRTNATSRNSEDSRAGGAESPKRKDRYDDDLRIRERRVFAIKSHSRPRLP